MKKLENDKKPVVVNCNAGGENIENSFDKEKDDEYYLDQERKLAGMDTKNFEIKNEIKKEVKRYS